MRSIVEGEGGFVVSRTGTVPAENVGCKDEEAATTSAEAPAAGHEGGWRKSFKMAGGGARGGDEASLGSPLKRSVD